MKYSLKIGLVAFLLCCLAIFGIAGVQGQVGNYSVEVFSQPGIVPLGKAQLILKVMNQKNQPVVGAQVQALAQMPGMPMGERSLPATPVSGKPGEYTVPASFAMAGSYDLTVRIQGSSGNAVGKIPIQTGENTAVSSSGFQIPIIPILVLIVLFGLIWFILRRLKQLEVRPKWESAFQPNIIFAVVILIIAFLIGRYAVEHWRRPGSMTPLQAQTMSMNMPPPPYSATVTLVRSKSGKLNNYYSTGANLLALNSVGIVARTSGFLIYMPFYVGDKVQKGEVIARLDTSEIAPQIAQAENMVNVARAKAKVAQYQVSIEKQNAVQSAANTESSKAELGIAQANLQVAELDKKMGYARLATANAKLNADEANYASEKSKFDYWNAEIAREKVLFAKGAISVSSFQKEKADFQNATATLQVAKSQIQMDQLDIQNQKDKIQQANLKILSEKQMESQANSGYASANAGQNASSSNVLANESGVVAANANLAAAENALQQLEIDKGYAVITAPFSGTIVQRIVAPGPFVTKGQMIAELAEVNAIRVQANVPESDIPFIHVGGVMKIFPSNSATTLEGTVDSISPSVNPNSRQGIVEAIIPNPGQNLDPGGFVKAEVQLNGGTGVTLPSRVVHSEAISSSNGIDSSVQYYVWTATPAANSQTQFTVNKVLVTVDTTNGRQSVIKSGLGANQWVVDQGSEVLTEGETVKGQFPTSESLQISITPQGFVPNTLTIPAGHKVEITFLRTTNQTCAKSIVFPSLGIKKDLPLNVPVRIPINPSLPGTISFQCGMNMLHGSIVAEK